MAVDWIFRLQHVHNPEINPVGHRVDDSPQCLCHSRHHDYYDWFQGCSKCWIPLMWSWSDLQKAVRQWIQSLQWIPLLFFTDNLGTVVLSHIHTIIKCIPAQNWQRQSHNSLPRQQCWCDSHCHPGKYSSEWAFYPPPALMAYQHLKHFSANEPYGPNVVHRKLGSRKARNWVVVFRERVSFQFANQMGTQQPASLINTLMIKFVVDCVEKSAQYWTAIIWI